MILYKALQPLLLTSFKLLALTLKHIPGLRSRTRKLWTTYDIRYVDNAPAFLQIDRAKFGGIRPIWIHAASGEFEYAKPVIRELYRLGRPVLVTYFSPTYAENVRAFTGVTASCPLPLDSRTELDRFLDYLNPAALLIARTDAWPNTVLATSLRKIPILLFSTTFHEGSNRMRGLGKSLTIETLRLIDQIQCVSSEDRSVLNSIGITQVETCGDSRYDQVLERLAKPKPLPDVLLKSVMPKAFVAGSVWPEDLKPVIEASLKTSVETPHTLFIVPHEISDSFNNQIEAMAQSYGLKPSEITRFKTLMENPNATTRKYRMIIVDAVGFLAELYQLGEIAFVGGSFRKTVHSVMEPLAAGALTVVGPLHTNNREAIEFQKLTANAAGAVIPFVTAVRDEHEFTNALALLWKASGNVDFKSRIREEVKSRGGATAFILRWTETAVRP